MAKPKFINRKAAPAPDLLPDQPDGPAFFKALENAAYGAVNDDFYLVLEAAVHAQRDPFLEIHGPPGFDDFGTGNEHFRIQPFLDRLITALRTRDFAFFSKVADSLERIKTAEENGAVDFIGEEMIWAYASAMRAHSRAPSFQEWKLEFESWNPNHGISNPTLKVSAEKLQLKFADA